MKAKIGVMSEELIRTRILAIATGEYKPESDEPKVWYTSLNSIAQLLCPENIELLKLMDIERPESLTELSILAGRAKPNISKTVNALASKGFVRLEKMKGNILKPVALFTEFELIVNSPVEARIQRILSFKTSKIA